MKNGKDNIFCLPAEIARIGKTSVKQDGREMGSCKRREKINGRRTGHTGRKMDEGRCAGVKF